MKEDHGHPSAEVSVLDGAAVVYFLPLRESRTFGEYARDVFIPYLCSDLVAVYTERMQNLISEPVGQVNSTRLKERLLQQCMFLKAVRHGRNVLLTYDSAVGDAIVKACSDEDEEAMELANAAKIVRMHILNCGHSFNGSLCEPDNVTSKLTALVNMILVVQT